MDKKKKILLTIKEVAIILTIIVVVVFGGLFAFKNYIPYNMEIPDAEKYVQLVKSNYQVVGDIQDAQDATETFSTSSSELEIYQTEVRYVPGTVNPFKNGGGENDLPSELVSSSNYTQSQIIDVDVLGVSEE